MAIGITQPQQKLTRSVCFYVSWNQEEEIQSVTKLLEKQGCCILEVDSDIDLEDYPQVQLRHSHTVFRFLPDAREAVPTLLASVAEHPAVYSVGEMSPLPGQFRLHRTADPFPRLTASQMPLSARILSRLTRRPRIIMQFFHLRIR